MRPWKDNNEETYYNSVVDYLKSTFRWDHTTQDRIMLHSGDNSVLVRGPFGGHSLAGLKRYVAEVNEKEVYYDPDDY